MNSANVSLTRLANQQIENPSSKSPKELVHRMGAMQAQDYNWVKWAMGIRLPGSSLKTIETAIAEGDIIRTHLLRPTWHIVSVDDLRWMLELTAPRVMVSIRSRQKQLGLTKEVITQTNKVIEKALVDEDYLTREALVAALEKNGYKNENNLASHILLRAELDGVICSGPTDGKNYTYTLFQKRVPASPSLSKEEGLQRLASIYFMSHGPATLEDFVWWSGLTKTMAREGMEMIKPEFEQEEIDAKIYWFKSVEVESSKKVYLLPAYDEYIVGYADRGDVLAEEQHKKVISMNGIFKPVIVVDGKVKGFWKRTTKKQLVFIETTFFEVPSAREKEALENTAEKFAAFLNKRLKINMD